jgi:hypothetical protein
MLLMLGVAFLIAADIVLAIRWDRTLSGGSLGPPHRQDTGLALDSCGRCGSRRSAGAALGVFNLMTGGALLSASALAGWLWTEFGPAATFTAGAVFAGIALLGMLSRGI